MRISDWSSDVCSSDLYDAALCCTPDAPKADILRYLLANRKHALVEKPLWAERDGDIVALENLAREHGVVCYTAYNHRFEPHYIRMRDLIASGVLGQIYRRSEEHTSELQSLMRISYAGFCLKKKNYPTKD